MKPQVLVLINMAPTGLERLEAAGFDVRPLSASGSREAAIRDAADARAVLTNGSIGLSTAEIQALPKLELICAVGVGYENIDRVIAAERGIAVTNGRGTNDTAVADHAFALVLAIASAIVPGHALVQDGGWAQFLESGKRTNFSMARQGVYGKKLGIVGLGRIGQKIARRGSLGFDMPVGYHSRRAVADVPYTYFDSVGDLAEWADFLVAAAPGGAETRHLINEDVLQRLGPTGYVVNIGRGTVVSNDALIRALQEGWIAGAGLDVVEGEPNIPSALLGHENLVITPHMAGRTPESAQAMENLIVDNLIAHFSGQPLITPVDPPPVA